jgi:hypothetical protein
MPKFSETDIPKEDLKTIDEIWLHIERIHEILQEIENKGERTIQV